MAKGLDQGLMERIAEERHGIRPVAPLNEAVHCVGKSWARDRCPVGVIAAWWTIGHGGAEGACPRHAHLIPEVRHAIDIERVNETFRFGYWSRDKWGLPRRALAALGGTVGLLALLLFWGITQALGWLLVAAAYPMNESLRSRDSFRQRFKDHMKGWRELAFWA